jgi:zinc and cadmium transporter
MTAVLFFSLGAVVSTLAGGYLVLRKETWAKKHLWRFLAFGSGVLLGITVLHLLPEAWKLNPRVAGICALAAFIVFFILEEFTVVHACTEIADKCRVHSVGYGALAALTLHSFADGLAMAFSFLSSAALGTMVSTAVIAHKFSDGLTLSSLFRESGYAVTRTWVLLIILALATPAGVLFGMGSGYWITPHLLPALLGLAAGGFLYVSAADILPRLHRSRDPICWLFLLVGMGLSLLYRH